MAEAPTISTWVIYNPFTNRLYLRRSLFKVRYDHDVVGTLGRASEF